MIKGKYYHVKENNTNFKYQVKQEIENVAIKWEQTMLGLGKFKLMSKTMNWVRILLLSFLWCFLYAIEKYEIRVYFSQFYWYTFI